MKKLLTVILAIALLSIPVLAAADISKDIADLPSERQQPLLVDEGDILTEEEEAKLLNELERISAEQKCDVAVIIPRSLGYKSAESFTEDFYDQYGYGQGTTKDGVMLMVCMEERDYYFDSAGAAQDWFDLNTKLRIEDTFLDDLSSGRYLSAFLSYASSCEQVLRSVDRREILYLSDQGSFLNAEEQRILTRTLESYSHVGSLCDIVVLTVMDLDGKTAKEFTESLYAGGGYLHGNDHDKIVMVVDRAASKCYCVTGGSASRYFSDDDLKNMEAALATTMSEGNTLGAFTEFAETAYGRIRSYFESQYQNSGVAVQRSPQLFSGFRAFISAVVGLFTGLGTTAGLKKQLKSVKQQTAAADYIVRSKMRMTDEQDLFLYSNVAKTVRVSENRTGSSGGFGGGGHFSSGGVSHSGHGGKF